MENPAFDVAALLAPPDILKSKCALCIQPHPDDNEIGMGGTVAVLAQAGCTVHYLTVTNGDQGNKNRTASPQETARVRRAEAIAAGTHLGAKAFHFLDLGDGTLADVLGLSVQIARVIREVRPDAIFAPDPWLAYESHLDHAVTGRAAANAFLMSGRAAIPGGGDTQPTGSTEGLQLATETLGDVTEPPETAAPTEKPTAASTEATEAAEERSRGQISTVTIPVTANSATPIANPVPMFSMNFDPRNVPADDPTICAPP